MTEQEQLVQRLNRAVAAGDSAKLITILDALAYIIKNLPKEKA